MISRRRSTVVVGSFGASRTLTDCNDTIARHVVDANPWARVDVYAHLPSDVTSETERKRMMASIFP